jgi:hypothetical protein
MMPTAPNTTKLHMKSSVLIYRPLDANLKGERFSEPIGSQLFEKKSVVVYGTGDLRNKKPQRERVIRLCLRDFDIAVELSGKRVDQL